VKRQKPIVILGDGDRCPRCGVPMQYVMPDGIGDRQRSQRFFIRAGSAASSRADSHRQRGDL